MSSSLKCLGMALTQLRRVSNILMTEQWQSECCLLCETFISSSNIPQHNQALNHNPLLSFNAGSAKRSLRRHPHWCYWQRDYKRPTMMTTVFLASRQQKSTLTIFLHRSEAASFIIACLIHSSNLLQLNHFETHRSELQGDTNLFLAVLIFKSTQGIPTI